MDINLSLLEILVIINIVLSVIVLLYAISAEGDRENSVYWTARKLEDIEQQIKDSAGDLSTQMSDEAFELDRQINKKDSD